MNKTYYLLVPVKGMAGFKAGMDISKIRVHAGRKGKDEACQAFERELNGGKTWNEWLQSCKTKEEFDKHNAEAWKVYDDTERNWSDYRGSEQWPAMKQIDDMRDLPVLS
jgi:hypothetical protein